MDSGLNMKPIPLKAEELGQGTLVLPDSAKLVELKSEMTENGEDCGFLVVDGEVLRGRWFTESEARSIARGLGATYGGDPALSRLPPMPGDL